MSAIRKLLDYADLMDRYAREMEQHKQRLRYARARQSYLLKLSEEADAQYDDDDDDDVIMVDEAPVQKQTQHADCQEAVSKTTCPAPKHDDPDDADSDEEWGTWTATGKK